MAEAKEAANPKWVVITKPFHQFVEGDDEAAKQAALDKIFEGLVGSDHNEAAVEALSSPDFVPDDDILALFESNPKALVRRAIAKMRTFGVKESSDDGAVRVGTLLPEVPDDDNVLKLLRTGGLYKFGEADAVAAVRVLTAQGLDLDGVEKRVLQIVERRAEELEEAVPEIWYELDRSTRRKAYADVLSALDVSKGIMTVERRKQALEALRGIFFDLEQVNTAVQGWYEIYREDRNDIANLADAMRGGESTIDAPDVGPVLSSAESFRGRLNRRFSGVRIPVVRGIAAEIFGTVQFLDNPKLIAATGAGSKEELYRKLGLEVGNDLVRAEKSALTYLLALLKIEEVGEVTLPQFIVQLAKLGKTLPWGLLQGASGTSQGSEPHGVRSQRRGGSPLGD